tara:strand:+ start:356 stop:565 length:210 start_codon:yes stop_codon:yes gene_type:complete
MNVAMVTLLTGLVDSIDSQIVTAEINALGIQNELVLFPVSMFPCNINEGDSFYFSYDSGFPKVFCGNPE